MSLVKSAITLFSSIVARRGKGAKGTVQVQTFGKPVVNKRDKKTGKISPVTRFFSYSHANDVDTEALIVECKKIAPINEILMRGADLVIKSGSIKAQSSLAILASEIFTAGLAIDAKDASTTATAFLSLQAMERKLGRPVTSIEKLMADRKAAVDKLKEEGRWIASRVAQPKLVKKAKPATEEASEPVEEEEATEEEEETEDTVEEEEEEETEEEATE